MLESMLAAQYEALNAEVEDTAFVELPVGEAIRVQVAMSINLPGGSENLLHQIQYILTQDTSMYVLTFSVEAAQFEAYLPTFDAIAESFGIGEAPDGNTAERPPASDLPPEGRSDIVRHDTPWINIVAPSDWFAARDVDAFAEHIATNGGHPMATPFFETLAGDVASGTWSYILVEPNDLAYMTLLVNEMGADIPVSTFQTPQEDIVKEDPDITFIDGSLITTPSGDAVRIEVTRPIRAGEIHHELRVFWMENQSLFYMILAVPEAVYPEYEQIFEDIINTVSFPDQ
jgi:hypothetical protein